MTMVREYGVPLSQRQIPVTASLSLLPYHCFLLDVALYSVVKVRFFSLKSPPIYLGEKIGSFTPTWSGFSVLRKCLNEMVWFVVWYAYNNGITDIQTRYSDNVKPTAFWWEDGTFYSIDFVGVVECAVSFKAEGQRYPVRVRDRATHLFRDGDIWVAECKGNHRILDVHGWEVV